MNSRRVHGFAVVLGAAGAIMGAALLSSPVAYADGPPPLPFGLQPFPDIFPPGSPGEPTDSEVSGIPYLFWDNQETVPYSIADINPLQFGDYVANQEISTALGFNINGAFFPNYAFFSNDWMQVIDSTGAAPAVGTVFDESTFAVPIISPGPPFLFPLPVLQSFYESDPTGTTQELFQIDILNVGLGNYISTGPAGLLDELTVEGIGNFAIPILDIPASASTGAATDAGALLPDVAALF
jgi:hypothetical protein